MVAKEQISMVKIPKSTNILEVGHSEDTMTMRIMFKGGAIYDYHNVPRQYYYDMISGTISVGGYFHKNIRGKFNTIMIKDKDLEVKASITRRL